jgi:hypothetical protein
MFADGEKMILKNRGREFIKNHQKSEIIAKNGPMRKVDGSRFFGVDF